MHLVVDTICLFYHPSLCYRWKNLNQWKIVFHAFMLLAVNPGSWLEIIRNEHLRLDTTAKGFKGVGFLASSCHLLN